MIYFMLKLRYISGDDPENENSKNKRKVKGIWLKKQRKQKRLFPKARKSINRNSQKNFFLFMFLFMLFLVGRNRLVYFWGKGYEA